MIKKTARFLAYAAIFLIPIFPLIVANSLFFPFITGKAFYFRILVEVAFAAWLVLAFLDARYRPRWSALTVSVLVFAGITLLADLLGVNPLRSLWSNFERMEGWITIIHLTALYFVTTGLFGAGEEGRRMWHRFLNVELGAALIVGIYGLFQVFGWAAIHQGSTRIDASLGNAAYMAVYMLINAFIAAYLFFVARAKRIANFSFLSWAYPVLALLFAFEVFETATRGTILGLTGGILLALFLYAVLAKNASNKSRQISIGVIVLIIVLGAGLWASRNTAFVHSHEVLDRLASISLTDTQGQARAYIWPMALKGFTQRPVLGWGQENFNYIFNANYNPQMWNQEQWFDRAHSVFLDWLTASGLFGLLAYLALYLFFLRSVWKSSLSVAEKSVLTGLLAGYAVHNIFVFDNLASYVLFFVMLGFADSFHEPRTSEKASKALSPEAVEYVALPIILIALVFTIYFFDSRPITANKALITALESCSTQQPDATYFQKALAVNVYVANQEIREQVLSCTTSIITNQSIPGATKQAYYTLANQAIADQIAATPWKDARIYALGGSLMNSISQFDSAATLLQTSHELSPAKQSITLQLALSLINQGKADQAVPLLKTAYESATNDTTVESTYVVALIASGQDALAHQLFFASDPSVFQSIQVAQAYMFVKQYTKAVAVYKALLAASPDDVNAAIGTAQAQYAAGLTSDSIATLRALEKAHPEYKDQIETSIKQVEAGTVPR